jgi:hypothetical protein
VLNFQSVANWFASLRSPSPGQWLLGAGVMLVPVAFLLLLRAFQKPGGVQPVQLVGGKQNIGLSDPFPIRVVTALFGGKLVSVGQWYRLSQRERLEERLTLLGLEQVPVGAWLILELFLAAVGLLLLLGGATLVNLPPALGVTGALLGWVLGFRWPQSRLVAQIKVRNAVQVQQLVPWLQEVSTLLKIGILLQDALKTATMNQRQYRRWPALPRGLDLHGELERALDRWQGGMVGTLEEALEEMQARCPQTQVNDALEEMRLALLSGAKLAEALENSALLAQESIDHLLLQALERRIPVVHLATYISAFMLYIGTIFGVIGLDLAVHLVHIF